MENMKTDTRSSPDLPSIITSVSHTHHLDPGRVDLHADSTDSDPDLNTTTNANLKKSSLRVRRCYFVQQALQFENIFAFQIPVLCDDEYNAHSQDSVCPFESASSFAFAYTPIVDLAFVEFRRGNLHLHLCIRLRLHRESLQVNCLLSLHVHLRQGPQLRTAIALRVRA